MRATLLPLLLCGVSLAATSTEIRLWTNGAPGSEGKTASEVAEAPNKDHGYLKVTSVHQPSLTAFLPPADKGQRRGHDHRPRRRSRLPQLRSGGDLCRRVSEQHRRGRLSCSNTAWRAKPGSTYKIEEHAFADGQRAIRLLRNRAAEFQLNPARIGIMGFSAGGEVAALAATRFDPGKPDATDPIDRQSSRPDFDALIYPGIRANTYTIPKDMPVTFLLCADNDRGPSTALSALYPMLKAAGIQTEVHVYATGGHGFGINPNTRNPSPVATTWQLRLGDWLKQIGMLK